MAAAAEVTVICIDNSQWVYGDPIYTAQLEAIQFCCETKFKCNPDNLVGLFIMGSSSSRYGTLLFPTSDLQQILRCLRDVQCGGEVEFSDALGSTWASFYHSPPNMKRRLLMFVGSPINMHDTLVKPYGKLLKERGIALDVVNFFVLTKEDELYMDYGILYGTYHYARKELDELVTIVNDNDNSHILDVDVSSVRGILSRSILKKNLRYLRKKVQKKAKENVNVKQELELSRNEKNKAAAEYGKHFPLDLKPGENEKVKLEAARCMRVA